MNFRKILPFFLLAATLLMTPSCKGDNGVQSTITTEPVTQEADVQQAESETEKDYYVAYTPEEKPKDVPAFTHPLTGLSSDKDISTKRPVSIMVNNIQQSLPQSGLAGADIIYECLAEGGITRLMMISTNYETLTKIGSVRSARDYYIDFAQGYDCIFTHAGGSTYANNTLKNRGVNNIDGVKGPTGSAFKRDQNRINAGYAYEHTLFIPSGKKLESAVDSLGYRKTVTKGYEKPMNFTEWGDIISLTSEAKHVKVVMSNIQTVDFVYNEKEMVYYRFQYNGKAHIDEAAKKQLSFKNVILMYNDCGSISGDAKHRIWMQTTGEGKGYYITQGTYREIIWKKANATAPVKYYYTDGTEVKLNRGKTMVNVVSNPTNSSVKFDNDTKLLNKK